MHAEVRKIRKFINSALRLAHEEVKAAVPSFFDFRKHLKSQVSAVHLQRDQKGNRMVTLSLGNNGRVKVEIAAEGTEEKESLQKLKSIMLDSYRGLLN